METPKKFKAFPVVDDNSRVSPFMTSNTETSIITSTVHQINLSNENLKYKHWCFLISQIVSQKIIFAF